MASDRIQRQIDRLLDEAEQASELEDWDTFGNRASRVLAFHPENAVAAVFLAAAERSLADAGSPVAALGPDPEPLVAPAERGRGMRGTK